MNSAKWAHFEPRADDIIITTSYKAGTTWMQGICAALVFQQPQPPVPQDALTPWFDSNFAPLDVVLEQIRGLQHRRYIKTHCPLDGIRFFDEVKYIFVGRDGRDVFMSMWNHWHNMQPEGIDALNNAPDRAGPISPTRGIRSMTRSTSGSIAAHSSGRRMATLSGRTCTTRSPGGTTATCPISCSSILMTCSRTWMDKCGASLLTWTFP